MTQRWYQKATVQASLVGGVFAVLAVILGSCAHQLRQENARMLDQMDKWRFSEPLYRRLPGDVDFVARGIRVDKKEGGGFDIVGPGPADRFVAEITRLQPAPSLFPQHQQYSVQFRVSGVVNGNLITPGPTGQLAVRPSNLGGPYNAGSHEFYLFVDRVDVDYVFLTVARRPLNMPKVVVSLASVPFNLIHVEGKRPDPILVASP